MILHQWVGDHHAAIGDRDTILQQWGLGGGFVMQQYEIGIYLPNNVYGKSKFTELF